MPDVMRIQRALARAGVASRRRAEELVAAGRVLINGATSQRPARASTSTSDKITVDGKPLATARRIFWIVLNKPAGVLTTKTDPRRRRTVFDLVPEKPGLTYVGRLDYMTEGVLLFTTDGEAAHKLTHPSREVERTYLVTVRGDGAAAVRAARTGVELEDGWVKPLDVRAHNLSRGLWELEITLAEGRTRESQAAVRGTRAWASSDSSVRNLVRSSWATFRPARLVHSPGVNATSLPRS